MVGESDVVIKTPNQHFFASEGHMRAEFSFQLWKSEVAMRFFRMLTQRAAILGNAIKNVQRIQVLKLQSQN
jgi:hypothetical protein